MKGDYLALSGRIQQALVDLEQVVQRAEWLMTKATTTNEDGFWDGVALNLHGFYAGVEQIFEDIARTIDDHVPAGSNWHRDLLLQLAADLATVRPAVLRPETRRCLDEYRGFRHVVRHVYTFNLRPSRLHELTKELPACLADLTSDLQTFGQFLRQV